MTLTSANKPNGSTAFYGLQLERTSGEKWFFPWSHLINIQCENAGKLSILFSSRDVVLSGHQLDRLFAELVGTAPPARIEQQLNRPPLGSGEGWQVTGMTVDERDPAP